MKDYERSLDYLSQAWEIFEGVFGKESEQVAHCFLEIASIYYKKKEIQDAITFQERAMACYSTLEKFSNTDFYAQISISMSEMLNS
jgi:tetratricopeptide (TPR) repeat protein